MKIKLPFFIAILGPTGVGKTDFALALGAHLPIEIVNGDLGQFYTPLSIGTAKPDWRSYKIPHHLFDIVDEPRNYTVVEYRALLIKTLQEIWQRGNLPVIVGGSGFYLKSLLYPPVSPTHETSTTKDSVNYSWQLLHELDPERAASIAPGDTYRIARALDIIKATQGKASAFQPVYDPFAEYLFLFITREREDLYARINERTRQMMVGGFVEEVQQLQGTAWEQFLREKKMIGYDDILNYLATEKTDADRRAVIETIAQRTRNYAKRQITFWRSLQEQIAASRAQTQQTNAPSCAGTRVINLTLSSSDLYINQLSEQLMKLFEGNV